MASVDKIKIKDVSYTMSPAPSGTLTTTGDVVYTSNDVNPDDATSYVSVNKIEATETNSSIFSKITSMVRNIRYLYNKLGTTDISEISDGTVTGSISNLSTNTSGLTDDITDINGKISDINTALSNKAALSHSHTVADLPVSDVQINSNQYIPTSSLVYSMNNSIESLKSLVSSLNTAYNNLDVRVTKLEGGGGSEVTIIFSNGYLSGTYNSSTKIATITTAGCDAHSYREELNSRSAAGTSYTASTASVSPTSTKTITSVTETCSATAGSVECKYTWYWNTDGTLSATINSATSLDGYQNVGFNTTLTLPAGTYTIQLS